MHINQGLSEELFRLFTNIGHANHNSPIKPALTPIQYTLMLTIAARPRRGTDLVGVVGLDQSTISRRIAQLCDAGLAERIPDPDDGRAQLVRLTGAGVEMVEGERARRVRTVTDALDEWEDEERADLARLLAHLNETLEAQRGLATKEPRV
ncbi:hypothetical protein BW730_15145 [Tessaracoccus aquimaris]|uniref:HTH marR-type domain-containing protein n=1 Tax=Tessaracoccus aquimaris TaxID=1332264 RepID=A0A1Q2CRI2_9ACTN|nr:MarR family winged helix-turn-helix transcriptional regulator [Tessaracoccus aquimaris]AQP48640.1 hypothetical protein BW730_15145 [Tessaracoccus aquimaris]